MRALLWLVGMLVVVVAAICLLVTPPGSAWALSGLAVLWIVIGLGLTVNSLFRFVMGSARSRALRDALAQRRRPPEGKDDDKDA
jgi:Na+/melibiose symporter-like transporter